MRILVFVFAFFQTLAKANDSPDAVIDTLFHQNTHNLPQTLSQFSFLFNSTSIASVSQNSSILILSFASANIMSYALPALFINHLYAFHQNCSFRFLHEGNSGDYFPQDRRWNKIAAILDALENDWGKDYPVLVSHDADLIFTDFTFDLHELLAQHPHAHVLLSSDTFDLANSGFILLRNTKWSYQFFLTWYSARYAHSSDQQALTALIDQMKTSKSFQKRFLILPKGPPFFSSLFINLTPLSRREDQFSPPRRAHLPAPPLPCPAPHGIRGPDSTINLSHCHQDPLAVLFQCISAFAFPCSSSASESSSNPSQRLGDYWRGHRETAKGSPPR
jgi:hypothetical protein